MLIFYNHKDDGSVTIIYVLYVVFVIFLYVIYATTQPEMALGQIRLDLGTKEYF